MKAWTFDELMFANETCFPADFIHNWARITGNRRDAEYYASEMIRAGGLVNFIFKYSRVELRTNFGSHLDELIEQLLEGTSTHSHRAFDLVSSVAHNKELHYVQGL
jgi:hypothetical protein